MASTAERTTWSYESEGGVGVWTIHDVAGLFDAEIAAAQQHFRTTAGGAEITAAVVYFDDDASLSREVQDHMADAWTELGRAVDLERTAYVADGVRGMAVKSNVDIPDTELKAFTSLPDAVEWAGR